MTEGERKQALYEESRRQHRLTHPIVESSAPFVITPELERERASRLANQRWREPAAVLTEADVEILHLKGII